MHVVNYLYKERQITGKNKNNENINYDNIPENYFSDFV